MSKAAWRGARPRDIDRLIERARKAGLPIHSVETTRDGQARVIVGKPGADTQTGDNPWDRVFSDAADKKRAS